ncbi:hypothetical protein EK904_014289 [Melospiza melodia maxima]|nr:hypothetical protein EK904_014289 [Melospiza melodia maxima]
MSSERNIIRGARSLTVRNSNAVLKQRKSKRRSSDVLSSFLGCQFLELHSSTHRSWNGPMGLQMCIPATFLPFSQEHKTSKQGELYKPVFPFSPTLEVQKSQPDILRQLLFPQVLVAYPNHTASQTFPSISIFQTGLIIALAHVIFLLVDHNRSAHDGIWTKDCGREVCFVFSDFAFFRKEVAKISWVPRVVHSERVIVSPCRITAIAEVSKLVDVDSWRGSVSSSVMTPEADRVSPVTRERIRNILAISSLQEIQGDTKNSHTASGELSITNKKQKSNKLITLQNPSAVALHLCSPKPRCDRTQGQSCVEVMLPESASSDFFPKREVSSAEAVQHQTGVQRNCSEAGWSMESSCVFHHPMN